MERELVLRLASLLWRLRRATTIKTGLFEPQADHLTNFRRTHQISPVSREVVYALFNANSDRKAASHGVANTTETSPASKLASTQGQIAPDVELARCFLRLCNLPNYALDPLSRYEATLWRQAGQILFALDNLDRHKPRFAIKIAIECSFSIPRKREAGVDSCEPSKVAVLGREYLFSINTRGIECLARGRVITAKQSVRSASDSHPNNSWLRHSNLSGRQIDNTSAASTDEG